jgi:tetratricopeptide (TPR) repeat protein
MTTPKAALALTLLFGGAASALAQPTPPRPAATQSQVDAQQQPAAQPAQRQFNLSRPEQQAVQPLLTAAQAGDWAAAAAALPAASAAARGNDAKYLIGQIRRLVGVNTQNLALESQGLDEMIGSGSARPEDVFGLYELQFDLATRMNDRPKADRALAELVRLNPNDVNLVLRQVQQRIAANDRPAAIQLYRRAIEQRQTANQPVPVQWRRNMMALAYEGRTPETIPLYREYLAAEPTRNNWHDGIVIYSQVMNADAALQLDLFRLMRAANAMIAEADFMTYYQVANDARLFGEAKTALDEGLQRNLIVQNASAARSRLPLATQRVNDDRTSFAEGRARVLAGSNGQAALDLGDIYYNYGQYADAATLYRAALQKGADASIANLRLGAALALAGNRAEAETAFRAVGAGSRQELAQYWLVFLSTRTP